MIQWEQNEAFVLIKAQADDKSVVFRLDDDAIIHLINNTPRIYYFILYYGGKVYEDVINFDNLQPIIKRQTKLSIKVQQTSKQETSVQTTTDGYYVILRGESFLERCLSKSGWQTQEYRFSFALWDLKNFEKKIKDIPIKQEENQVVEEPKIVCSNCNAVLEFDYEICPVCFTYRIKREPDVEVQL